MGYDLTTNSLPMTLALKYEFLYFRSCAQLFIYLSSLKPPRYRCFVFAIAISEGGQTSVPSWLWQGCQCCMFRIGNLLGKHQGTAGVRTSQSNIVNWEQQKDMVTATRTITPCSDNLVESKLTQCQTALSSDAYCFGYRSLDNDTLFRQLDWL